MGIRIRELPGCSAVPQPTSPPRAPAESCNTLKNEWMFFNKLQLCLAIFINLFTNFSVYLCLPCRSQLPRGLRRRSSAARLLRLWVRIPPEARMFVCCECCVLSGRGLCDGFITRPEESYLLWRVVVCDQETSKTRRLMSATGLWKYNHNGL